MLESAGTNYVEFTNVSVPVLILGFKSSLDETKHCLNIICLPINNLTADGVRQFGKVCAHLMVYKTCGL